MSNSDINSKNSEFTPIGYLSNKRRKLDPSGEEHMSPAAKRANTISGSIPEGDGDDEERSGELSFDEDAEDIANDSQDEDRVHKVPRTGWADDDNTMDSNRLFTETSQFDDTLPEIPDVHTSTSSNNTAKQFPKNLLPSINDASMSEPIREQQELTSLLLSGKRLSTAQINFFLQYLKSSNIFNKPARSSGQASQDQERYNTLYADYMVLQRKYSDLVDSNSANIVDDDDSGAEEANHDECEKKQSELQKQIAGYKKELEVLKGQHQKKIQQLNDLNAELTADIQGQKKLSSDRKAKYEASVQELNEMVDALEEEKQKLEREYKSQIHKLEGELIDLRNGQQHSLTDAQRQLRLKEDEITSLERQVADITSDKDSSSTKLAEITRELKNKTEEFDTYKSHIESKLSQSKDSNKELHEAEQRNIETYIKQIESLTKEKADTAEKVSQVQTKLSETEQTLHALKEKHSLEVKYMNESVTKLSSEAKESRITIDKLKDEIVQKDKEISQNIFMIKNFKEKIQILEDGQKNDKTHTPGVSEGLFKSKLNEISNLQTKINQLENQIREKEKSLTQLNNEVRDLKESLEKANRNAKDTAEQLQQSRKTIDSKQSTIDDNLKIIDELKKKLAATPTGNDENSKQLSAKLEEITEQLKNARAANDKLQDQIINSASDSANKVSKVIEEKDMRIQELEDETKERAQALKTLKEKLKKAQTVIDSLEGPDDSHVHDLQTEIRKIRRVSQEQTEEIDLLKHEISILRDTNKRLKAQNTTTHLEADDDLRSRALRIEELNSALTGAQKKIATLQNMNKSQADSMNDLLERFRIMNDSYRIMKTTQLETEDKIDILKKDYQAREDELRERILAMEAENANLKDKLERESTSKRSRTRDEQLRDYYRLKYHREVRYNNSLRIMNDYLNKVSQNTTAQINRDYYKYNRLMSEPRRFEEPQTDYEYRDRRSPFESDIKYDYDLNESRRRPNRYTDTSSPLYFNRSRLKFKTVARLVQACVRMRQMAIKNHWDDQRIRNLAAKLGLPDSRGAW
ncbi:Spc110 protein [Maudiozyma humilis]|uniref:Spindle pole body component 110 n=1 Tax=Maudiozyma humilis TaxID=51915 RepID=A0AAV5S529_MAUHU|nr:Spc110 protein [Kazachstania humilis]